MALFVNSLKTLTLLSCLVYFWLWQAQGVSSGIVFASGASGCHLDTQTPKKHPSGHLNFGESSLVKFHFQTYNWIYFTPTGWSRLSHNMTEKVMKNKIPTKDHPNINAMALLDIMPHFIKGQFRHECNIDLNSFLGYSLLKTKFPPLSTFIQWEYCCLNTS